MYNTHNTYTTYTQYTAVPAVVAPADRVPAAAPARVEPLQEAIQQNLKERVHKQA